MPLPIRAARILPAALSIALALDAGHPAARALAQSVAAVPSQAAAPSMGAAGAAAVRPRAVPLASAAIGAPSLAGALSLPAPSALLRPARADSIRFAGQESLSVGLRAVQAGAAPGLRVGGSGMAGRALAGAGSPRRISAAPGRAADPAAAPALTGPARARAASAAMGAAVARALERAGPVRRASPEDARALGLSLERILRSEASADLPGADPAPASGGSMGNLPPGAAAASDALPPSSPRAQMLRTLEQIASVFAEHYAPVEWKRSLGVDFRRGYLRARERILAKPELSRREFQDILADFVASAKDYHAGILFHSTERAVLPLTILAAGGRHFIAQIDRKALPRESFPFEAGDEVLEFDGRPAAEAVAALTRAPNAPETDARLGQLRLTARARRLGGAVPRGEARLRIRRADGTEADASVNWAYRGEEVPQDVPATDGGIRPDGAPDADGVPGSGGPIEALRAAMRRLMPSMAHPQSEAFAALARDRADSRFMIGGKRSFVPRLGEVIWSLPDQVAAQIPFDAYIYKDGQGRRVGYIRIPDYMGDEAAAQVFARLVAKFEAETDALVVDQVNNPGGNMFYMFALLSMLSDRPLALPKHRVLIDEGDAFWAAEVIRQAGALREARQAMERILRGERAGLGSAEDEAMDGVLRYARFIQSELKAGRRLTRPVDLLGVGKIDPQPRARYTKPLVVLVNELDFSAADFFPAILQDNGRAAIFGVRTAGAGGGVKSAEFPNQHGIAGFSYTWTIAERADGRTIENLGVTPDARYDITAEDIRGGFAGYAAAVNAAVAARVPPPARPQDPRADGPRSDGAAVPPAEPAAPPAPADSRPSPGGAGSPAARRGGGALRSWLSEGAALAGRGAAALLRVFQPAVR